jgi:hypothetical protein
MIRRKSKNYLSVSVGFALFSMVPDFLISKLFTPAVF